MKLNQLKTLFLSGLLPMTLLVGCDVHEFPTPTKTEKVPVVLNLVFNTEIPMHQVIDTKTRASANPQDYDLRYTICIYRANSNGTFDRTEDARIIVTKDEVTDPDHHIETQLEEGAYRFIVWTDCVDAGSQDHKFFNPDDFAEVKLFPEQHQGNTAFRDAFHGTADATILTENSSREISIKMERPQARYDFVSTDLAEFITRVQSLRAKQEAAAAKKEGRTPNLVDEPTRSVDLNDFRVVIRYSGYMPSSFNLFTNQTADAALGVKFESSISQLSESEANLGFDFVLVNGEESSIQVALDIYDRDGTRLSSTDPIEIPIVRNKQTIVRGNFFTSEASGGIGISPGFDGDLNYPVQ